MCVVCGLILKKLLDKGLVSEGNCKMCLEELNKEFKARDKELENNPPKEFVDQFRQYVNEKGYDA